MIEGDPMAGSGSGGSNRDDGPETTPRSDPAGISDTPKPPYYAVIFTSLRTPGDDGYADTARRMEQLAAQQPGFLGMESARHGLGITVSYWQDLESIRRWRRHAEHLEAQRLGRERWYAAFRVRVAKVEREYGS
jgi:heme-degrading monooxygenase HmoA